MIEQKHIIIFSHGFGVRKDDGGLFTDISLSLHGVQLIMFDYNEIDERNNALTVKPFSKQVEILKSVISEQKLINPNVVIDLICHSQGCVVAALAQSTGLRKILLLSPLMDKGIERTIARYQNNPETIIDLGGISKLSRSDGSISLVPAEYWQERKNDVSPIDLYNKLAEFSEVFIIKPLQDSLLGETSFDGLSEIIFVIELDGNHNFTHSRAELCEVIKKLILI